MSTLNSPLHHSYHKFPAQFNSPSSICLAQSPLRFAPNRPISPRARGGHDKGGEVTKQHPSFDQNSISAKTKTTHRPSIREKIALIRVMAISVEANWPFLSISGAINTCIDHFLGTVGRVGDLRLIHDVICDSNGLGNGESLNHLWRRFKLLNHDSCCSQF